MYTVVILPKRHRPSPPTDGSAHSKCSRKRLHAGPNFRRCRHFLRLRPSRSLALLVAPTQLRASRALSLELAWDSFPYSQVEPVIRLNRPISGAGFAPASHRVLLAAPAGRWNDWPADSWMLHPLPSKPLRQVMRATTPSLICLRRAASVGSTITVGYFRDCYAKGRFRRDR